MNDKSVKPEITKRPDGVKKGLTTPVIPTAKPGGKPSNQGPSTPKNQSGKK